MTTQKERTKKYLQKFTRANIRIPREDYDTYVDHIKKKGYNSLNDFLNTIVEYDLNKDDIIPEKKKLVKIKI